MKSKLLAAFFGLSFLAAPAAAQFEKPGGWDFDVLGFHPQSTSQININLRHDRYSFGCGVGSGWGFGFNQALGAPGEMKVDMGRSFHFFVSDLVCLYARLGKHSRLSLGFGVDLKNFRMTGPTRFDLLPGRNVALAPYPDGSYPEWSKLHLFSTTYNLKYIHRFAKHFRFAVGPELYVVRAPGKRHEIRTRYTDADGHDHKERSRDIRCNKVGLNIVGMINYRNVIGLYVKYTPTHYFNSYHGPQFESVSTGLVLMGL